MPSHEQLFAIIVKKKKKMKTLGQRLFTGNVKNNCQMNNKLLFSRKHFQYVVKLYTIKCALGKVYTEK